MLPDLSVENSVNKKLFSSAQISVYVYAQWQAAGPQDAWLKNTVPPRNNGKPFFFFLTGALRALSEIKRIL